MIENILQFLADNKEILVGAALTVSEFIVILVNTLRRSKAKPVGVMDAKHSKLKSLIWSANPVNLFRKP